LRSGPRAHRNAASCPPCPAPESTFLAETFGRESSTPVLISRLDSQAPYVSSGLLPVLRGRYWDDAELRVRITALLSQHRRLRTSSLPLLSARCLPHRGHSKKLHLRFPRPGTWSGLSCSIRRPEFLECPVLHSRERRNKALPLGYWHTTGMGHREKNILR